MRKLLFPLLAILVLSTGCITIATTPGNQLPVAYIDSIFPTEVSPGGVVAFKGHGTDPDGTIAAYRWRSDVDGDLGTEASFETSSLSTGTHTIYFKVQDNSGNWSNEVRSRVTVSGGAAALPVINSFSANPGSITSGGSSTLSWGVTGATTVSINQGVGNVAATGTTTVSPATNTQYTLTATNATGSASATTQVVVSGAAPPPAAGLPVINSFAAVPPVVSAGDPTTLSWDVSNAASVNIDQGVGPVASSGSTSVSPVGSANYTLTATNSVGWSSLTIAVVVGAAPPAGEPDLVITDIERDGNTIRYTIKNQGSVSAGASTSKLVVDGVVKGYDTVVSLAAGASSNESFSYSYTCSLPADTVEVYADSGGAVAEGSEANNAYSESWSCFVVIMMPDLIITDIWKVSEITGDKIYYKIKNQGSGASGASTSAFYKYPCVAPCPPLATDSVAPLAAGEVRQEKFAAYNYTGAPWNVGVKADVTEGVFESDEGNNSRTEPASGL